MLWSALRAVTRRMLDDPDGQKWDNTDLLDYVNMALRDVSLHLPAPRVSSYGASASTYTLPADLLRVRTVFREGSQVSGFDYNSPNPWSSTGGRTAAAYYYLIDNPSEGQISFNQTVPTVWQLHYWGYRNPVVDDSSVVDVGSMQFLWDALAFYICYLAHLNLSVNRANLEQYSERPENMVGNPLEQEALLWLGQYQRLITEGRPR